MVKSATNQEIAVEAFNGPAFQFVEQVLWEDLEEQGGFGKRTTPLLVKGAVKAWPAWERWSFDELSALRQPDGQEVMFRFQNGLVEQGVTKEPPLLPISPYLRELAEAARVTRPEKKGLLSEQRLKELSSKDCFHLDWAHLQSFEPNRIYLAQWHILNEFPHLRKDFDIRQLWSGLRWTWEYVFIGPTNTVTGLHYDFPNNWFCQVRGTKEFILFAPDQNEHLCPSRKYDWGATLSDVNISQLDRPSCERSAFEKSHGLYARVEAGDALFVPRRNWHAVVSLEPSISLAVFGLTPAEILIGGGQSEAKNLLHRLGLYRKGNCTCHKMPTSPARDAA